MRTMLVVASVFMLVVLLKGADTQVQPEDASASERVVVKAQRELYQGKPIRWWAKRAVQARKDANARGRTIKRLRSAQMRASAHFFAWLANADCVYRHERGPDGWETRTGNGYFGGMQADLDFQRTYASDMLKRYGATADRWPWWAQLQMAYRGWLFRGWQPWPNTARACGLL